MRPTRFFAILAVLSAILFYPASAETAKAKDAEAVAVLERFTEAIGGAEAVGALKTYRQEAVFTMPSMGMEMEMLTVVQSEPGKLYTEMQIPGMGMARQGYNGKMAWSIDPIMGYREITGAELAMLKQNLQFSKGLELAESFETLERLSDTQDGEQTLIRVRGRNKAGMVDTLFFNAANSLLARWDTRINGGPVGEMPVSVSFADYRNVDGVLMPHQMVMKSNAFNSTITLKQVETNVEVNSELFEPPAEASGGNEAS